MLRSAALAFLPLVCLPQTRDQPARSVSDPGIVTTRQAITPAGLTSVFQGRVYGVAWAGGDTGLWVLHASDIYLLDWKNNRVVSHLPHGGTPGNQAIQAAPATGAAIFGISAREEGPSAARPRLATIRNNAVQPIVSGIGSFRPGAIAVSGAPSPAGLAVMPLVRDNKLAIIDIATGRILRYAETGIAPFAAAIDRLATTAWVSNLGGRDPRPGELFASPAQKPAERITIDRRGIASTGTVTRIDVGTGRATHTIAVGLHPTALVLDEARRRLYVANGNSESVSVIDTASNRVVRTIEIQPFSERVRGVAPTALQVSADGKLLYVACGGINAIAVVDLAAGRIKGLIPTGWYPNSLALHPSGKYLAVSSLLGAGSGWRETPAKRFALANRGSVAVVPIPDDAQLAAYTTAVAENNRLRLASAAPNTGIRTASTAAKPMAVPARSGEPSLIEHVVFIIKENRTYDQVLGDLPQGNGDPSLVMFGQDVTPNQHRFARDFVLLDNFYATGGNSADGHQWLTQANETEYCLWPGYEGRSYPFDGSDPMAYSSGGFLWDYALARGRTVRVYGEYAGRTSAGKSRQELLRRWEQGGDFTSQWAIRAPIEPLNKILASNYPAYSTTIPDLARAQIFLAGLKRFEADGKLPNLVFLQLPSNHTNGTTPGASTPKAMVADNDFATGQIVEALSRSRFWPKMAIFIVEDDAQNGVDHVDGHRTAAFIVSPYTRRSHVDSTFYSHQSILKTIELMLGLPTMSIFDLIATDMRNSFIDTPDLTPFAAIRPKQDLFEVNPSAQALAGPARTGALASSRMNFETPDAAPTERLNRIVWGSIKGWNTPYPVPRRSVFAPLSLDIDDRDR